MSLSTLSPWPDFFKRPIESVAPWQLRLRAIGGPSARFHQSARSGAQGPGADLVNIPGFAAWKDALAQAVRDKVEKAVIDEFGPRPGDQHTGQQQAWRLSISDMKHLWYYDLGEQVKELWLKVRDKSIPTLLAFFLALSHDDRQILIYKLGFSIVAETLLEILTQTMSVQSPPPVSSKRTTDSFAGALLQLNLVGEEGLKYFTIVSGSTSVEIQKLQRKLTRHHTLDELATILSTQYHVIFVQREWKLYCWDVCRYLYGYLELKGASYEEDWLRKIQAMSTRVIAIPRIEGGRTRLCFSIYDILPTPKAFVLRAIEGQENTTVVHEHASSHSLGHLHLTARQQLIYSV
ncbi:hypothetical protein JCM5353_000044 [Sporobolomyces roseus]